MDLEDTLLVRMHAQPELSMLTFVIRYGKAWPKVLRLAVRVHHDSDNPDRVPTRYARVSNTTCLARRNGQASGTLPIRRSWDKSHDRRIRVISMEKRSTLLV